MQTSLARATVAALSLAFCSLVQAQTRGDYHRYQGQRPNYTRNDPRRDAYDHCRKNYLKRGIPAEVFAACVDAIKDAEEAARYEATAAGCENGFYTGFANGLYYGSEDYRNHRGEFNLGMNAGKQCAFDLIDHDNDRGDRRLMRSANNAGWNKGNSEGDSDARETWVSALDRGIPQPNPHPEKELNFANSEWSFPYGQLVGQPLSLEQLAQERQYDINTFALYRKNNRRSRICNERSYYRDRSNIKGGQYYSKNGQYSTDRNAAINGQGGFDRWVANKTNFNARDARNNQSGRNGGTRAKELQNKKIEVAADQIGDEQPQNSTNTNSNPGRGGNNGGRGNANKPDSVANKGATAPTGQPQQQPSTKPPVVFDLWQIYADNFRSAYPYYAKDFYDDGFEDMLDEGANDGYGFGVGIGMEYSRQNGRVEGFNSAFRDEEHKVYNNAYQAQYFAKYDETFKDYQHNPVVRAQLLDIVETEKDGIFQPGEQIKAIYKLINYGGVEARVNAQLAGGGIESSNSAPAVIPAVTSKNVADGVLTATINSQLQSLQNAQIVLVVTGTKKEVPPSPIERTVTRQVTMDNSVSYNPLAAAGVVQVSLTVRNQSPLIPTSDDVSVVAVDNQGHRANLNIGVLPKGKVHPVSVEIKGIDPLSIYLDQVSFSVQVYKGKQLMGQSQAIGVRHNDETEKADLAKIFDDAAQSPSDLARAQAAKVQLVKEIQEEVTGARTKDYKNPEGTLVYEVVKAHNARGTQSASAKERYKELANEIRGFSKKLRVLGLFGKKGEKAYLNLVNELVD